jgi:NifU-like protein involved in Fe-S cluster formation
MVVGQLESPSRVSERCNGRITTHTYHTIMPDDLYNQKILTWASRLVTPVHLAVPDASAEMRGRLCGTTVRVELCMEGGIITGYGHDVRACRLGSAAAALLHDNILGTTASELVDLSAWMERMLMRDGAPPPGRWRDLDMFLPVRGDRFRAGTVLLPFQAVAKALGQQ